MSFILESDEAISDSEYELAKPQSFTPLESPPLDLNSNPARSEGKEKTKKKRRGTGVPASFLRFPRGEVEDIEKKFEVDELTTKSEAEVSVQNLMSTAKIHRDLLLQELKRDTNLQPGSGLPSNSASPSELKPKSTSSVTLAFRPKQKSKNISREDANQGNEFQSLQQSLTQIRAYLATLEVAISANITAQLVSLTGSPDPDVADISSLPSFQIEKKQKASVGAILGTVKVLCAVERGLEALVGAMVLVVEDEGDREKGLMDASLENPEEVALEMQKAIVGMRRVLKSIPVKQ